MYRSSMVVLIAALALPLQAEENPLSSEARQAWTRTRGFIVAAADKMPAESYGFKPAAESQSFGELVAHTASSAMTICSGFNGEARQAGADASTAKADLVAVLGTAMAECDRAYASLTDANATEMIAGRRGPSTRLGALYRNTIHLEHEYAQMAVHLRLKGLVPPSSEGR